MNDETQSKYCLVCGKKFLKPQTCSVKTWEEKRKYCSHECYSSTLIEKHIYKKNRKKICIVCGKEYICNRNGENFENQKSCSKQCGVVLRSGSNNCNFGKPMSDISKNKVSSSLKGREVWNKGLVLGEKAPNWKGGKKACRVREKAVRRQLGFIPLNKQLEQDWVGHHIDSCHVLFIPAELHRSIPHSVIRNRNMININIEVFKWFSSEYLEKLSASTSRISDE